MFRTIQLLTCFWILMIITIPFLIVDFILRLLQLKTLHRHFMSTFETNWGKVLVWLSGCSVTVSGQENIPDHNQFCLISNHQGTFDIILLLATIPKLIGFLAKKELKHFPVINAGMIAIHCVFIDRKNPRKALKGVETGIRQIKEGHALVIFPEGTRSQGPKMNPFKTGNVRMVVREGIPILPVTVDGSYKVVKNDYRIRSAPLTVHIHPLMETKGLSEKQKRELPGQLQEMIQSAVVFSH